VPDRVAAQKGSCVVVDFAATHSSWLIQAMLFASPPTEWRAVMTYVYGFVIPEA
jgi:hypothetical protein